MAQRDYVDKLPVLTRTQRRLERRQMWMMVILMAAVTAASFFLGVMVGERSATGGAAEPADPTMAQVAPPPPPPAVATAPRKLTFYEDLPKGNAAPLGSGINLPKGGYTAAVPPPTPPPVAAPVVTAPAPSAAPPAPAEVAAAPSSAPKPVAEKSNAGGAFVVQVMSTKSEAEARKVVSKLQGAGIAVHQERADLGAKGVWYRVVAGPYSDQAAANKVAEKVKKQKYAAIVRKK